MAKWFSPLVVVALFSLVGCQPQSASSTVAHMPPPSYSGPVLQDDGSGGVAAVPAAPRQVVVEARPPMQTPHPHHSPSSDDVPASWIPGGHLNSWQYIVVHHSATATGGAAAFDKMHKAKGWDELGYHFVIGNGTDTRDGQIEVGSRWPKQKWGAHTKTPDNRFNEHGIGICMVGNFDVSHPTDAQLKSLAHLVSYLMKTYHIPADHVVGHRDCKQTDCPGRFVSIARVRQLSVQMLADAGDAIPQDAPPVLASTELMHEAARAVR